MSEKDRTRMEKQIKKALSLSGFEPEVEEKFQNQKFDVFFEFEGLKFGFICKKFRNSTLSAKNFIEEWTERQKNFDVHRLVLVLTNVEVLEEDLELAREHDLVIWDREEFKEILDRAIKKEEDNKVNVLEDLNTDPGDLS